jgi:hypothetical protein
VGSREDGYERGSWRRDGALEREEMEELDEAIEGAISLEMVDSVDVDILDAMDNREWYDEAADERYEGAVDERNEEPPEASDMVDEVCEEATELRRLSMACWNMRWIMSGRWRASRASMCRIDSSGISRVSSMAGGGVRVYGKAWARGAAVNIPRRIMAQASVAEENDEEYEKEEEEKEEAKGNSGAAGGPERVEGRKKRIRCGSWER